MTNLQMSFGPYRVYHYIGLFGLFDSDKVCTPIGHYNVYIIHGSLAKLLLCRKDWLIKGRILLHSSTQGDEKTLFLSCGLAVSPRQPCIWAVHRRRAWTVRTFAAQLWDLRSTPASTPPHILTNNAPPCSLMNAGGTIWNVELLILWSMLLGIIITC